MKKFWLVSSIIFTAVGILMLWMLRVQDASVSSGITEGISRGMVCKAIALAMTDKTGCEQVERSVITAGDQEDWYAPYYAYLYQQGIVKPEEMDSSQLSMEQFMTTGELAQMLRRMHFTELAELCLQARESEPVDNGRFWSLYQMLLGELDTDGQVAVKTVQIYGTAANLTEAVAWQTYTSEGMMGFDGIALDYYIDQWIQVLQRDGEIIRVLGIADAPVTESQEDTQEPILKDASGIPMIRVLLKTSDYVSCYHEQVELVCEKNWLLQYGDQFEKIPAGQHVIITPEDARFANGTITAHATEEEISICTITRALGTPSYGGKLEITNSGEGLLLVNELPIESYLIKVVPSEMPSRYGLEAAKIQAVCARSYALRQIEQNACRAYGAHVDDSTSFQVYNNVLPQDVSVQAVQETEGEVLTDASGTLVSTYYFSTSCGYTTDITSWNRGTYSPAYLSSKAVSTAQEQLDMQNEAVFQSFIMDWSRPAYEQGMVWYRWKYTCSLEALTAMIQERLPLCLAQCPGMIGVETEDGICTADSTVNLGTITAMEAIVRGSGGIMQELRIVGSSQSLRIYGQTAIRKLLGAPDQMYDNFSQEGRSRGESPLLPSAFFCMIPEYTDGVITGYTFWGGGNGHGIGMSQNGAYAMTCQGMTYKDILQFFYNGCRIQKISEDFSQS